MEAGNIGKLVSLYPPDVLLFKLERNTQPKTILRVTNVSNQKVAFKVKTTQPSWYYVRPNQQLLDEGQEEDVTILMVENECNRTLDNASGGIDEKEDKQHRFLVQTKAISDEEYQRIKALSPAQRTDEISKLWEGPKDDKRNMKLRVEFVYPDLNASPKTAGTGIGSKPNPILSDNAEATKSKLTRNIEPSTNVTADVGSPEVILTELQNLRKKYDAVVEYTVHLTAERDSIVTQLEVAQRELSKEKSKKKTENVNTLNKEKTEQLRRETAKGFSLFVVLITALMFFLIGKYFA